MTNVMALIPARAGSKGIPDKNWKRFSIRKSPVELAIQCCKDAGIECLVSSDSTEVLKQAGDSCYAATLLRDSQNAKDETPMIDVVKEAMHYIDKQFDILLLVQPTQPLREPKHLLEAISLLNAFTADSVVSVVEIPRTYHPKFQYDMSNGWLVADEAEPPARRQDVGPTYVRDGTAYAFWRKTVEDYGSIYGSLKRAMVIPRNETCPLDTEGDWLAADIRLWDKRRKQ